MILYAGAFSAGFEKIIPSLISETVTDAYIERVESALVLFSSTQVLHEESLPFINTLYVCISVWNTNNLDFSTLIRNISASTIEFSCEPFLKGKQNFRLRFSRENQFTSVDKVQVSLLEKSISDVTGLVPDRLNAKTEFHLIIRREELSFFALKLTEKGSTEKLYEKGELRPETVRLMLHLIKACDEDYVICDPFAGYGSIPRQIAVLYPNSHLYINDIDQNLVSRLSHEFADTKRFTVSSGDACRSQIEKNSINLIVTDPPWGSFDASLPKEALPSFYRDILIEFERILISGGRAAVLTGAKKEFEGAISLFECFRKSSEKESFRTDILINGKKAAVYCLSKEY